MSNALSRYSLRERSPPARSRQRSASGYWYSPPAFGQRVLVFAADPGRDADAGFGRGVVVQGKWKPPERGIEEDRSRGEAGADIGVGQERGAEAQAPAFARPHDLEEANDVERHRRRQLAGQHMLELPPGELVLALEEEGAGELQPNARQLGTPDQHGAEGGDGLVKQLVALVLSHARPLGSLDRLHPRPEQSGHVLPSRGRAKGEADKDLGCGQGEGSRHGVLHSARDKTKRNPRAIQPHRGFPASRLEQSFETPLQAWRSVVFFSRLAWWRRNHRRRCRSGSWR